eukprot:TRINITY_DN12474_c0_g13_i1.p1 TRINITY_DN12474_c0_g13~~TRINITY_DN12474_c0_g13_i1.p1  ORF type:complete len:730 (+),score=163.64 TRINITY_DN12474_c0_g13_i1:57-2246(+)
MSMHQSAQELLQGVPVQLGFPIRSLPSTQRASHSEDVVRSRRLTQLDYNFNHERQVLDKLAKASQRKAKAAATQPLAKSPTSSHDATSPPNALFYQADEKPLSPVKLHQAPTQNMMTSRQDVDNDEFDEPSTRGHGVEHTHQNNVTANDAGLKGSSAHDRAAVEIDRATDSSMDTQVEVDVHGNTARWRAASADSDDEDVAESNAPNSSRASSQAEVTPDRSSQEVPDTCSELVAEQNDECNGGSYDTAASHARPAISQDNDMPTAAGSTAVSRADADISTFEPEGNASRSAENSPSLQDMLQAMALSNAQPSRHPPTADDKAVTTHDKAVTMLSPFSTQHFDPLASPTQDQTDKAAAHPSLAHDTSEFDLLFGGPRSPHRPSHRNLSLSHFDSLANSNPYDDLNLASLDDVAILGSLMGYAPVAAVQAETDDNMAGNMPDSGGDSCHATSLSKDADILASSQEHSDAEASPDPDAKPPRMPTQAIRIDSTPDLLPDPPDYHSLTQVSSQWLDRQSPHATTSEHTSPTASSDTAAYTSSRQARRAHTIDTKSDSESSLFTGADSDYFQQKRGRRHTSVSGTCSSDDEFGLRQAARQRLETRPTSTMTPPIDQDEADGNAQPSDALSPREETFVEMGFEDDLVKLVVNDTDNDEEVITRLFACQPLVEQGFAREQVVLASKQCQDEDILRKVLEAAPQLTAMGFDTSMSMQALVATNGDIGQAIDVVSRA